MHALFPVPRGARDKKTVTVISESERILPATRAVVTYSYTSHGEEITKVSVSFFYHSMASG